MPVRLRITFLFSILVFVILGLVCGVIYYFSYKARAATIQTRLTNRAITTARLLSEKEIFDQSLVRKIDSFTTISLKNKTVQAYDHSNHIVYKYTDVPGDTLQVSASILDKARNSGGAFYSMGNKEAAAYYYSSAHLVVITAAEDEEGRQNLQSLLRILGISFLIGNLLVLVSGYFFSRGLLLPIKKISEDVAEISAQNLARRIQTGESKDEWYQLTATLNDLLDRLQESFELQQRFIANASHELSTPLTSISSQLQVSLQRPRGAEEYKKVMQSVYQDVQHMNKLTQTLLEFAKASGSKGGIEIDLIRMDEVVLKLPAEISKLNTQYSITLEFHNLPEEEEALLVFGNEPLLFTAIKNIVVNACKYSPDHSAFVHLKVAEGKLVIEVEDKGIGISDEELSHIFQPFYRTDSSRFAGGFGLGLSLAQRIIKIHKGNISVHSQVNKGTTFSIELPAAEWLKNLKH